MVINIEWAFGALWRLLPAIVFSRAQYFIILHLLPILPTLQGSILGAWA
jgi:hypothetical protein